MSLNLVVKPTIFREYIGVKPYPDNLNDFPVDIINKHIPEFHFILGIATEGYDSQKKGTGEFQRTWNYDYFSPEKVKELKEKHKNVKVVISIGGLGADYPFNPAEKDVWYVKAIASIKGIIDDYNKVTDDCSCGNLIDGIDINYEVIKYSDTEFARSIGQVIDGLKKDGLIKVLSIAPSEDVRSHYRKLYQAHKNDIHWVGYQFYNQTLTNTDEFRKIYLELLTDYSAKLLAGFSTDPTRQGISREIFLDGCTYLINAKLLSGIFVWNANDSAAPITNDKPFLLEEIAQSLLIPKSA